MLILDDVRKTVEYDGRSWKVNRVIVGTGEHITLNLEAVPELPEEPPVGETLFDDLHRPHYHLSKRGWIDVYGVIRPWQKLLAYSDMRRCLVAGKGTDSLVRFKTSTLMHEPSNYPDEGPYYYSGFSFDAAPVHGYFEKVEE
jgi:hypothetical protein